MKIAVLISRILIGLAFTVAGAFGWVLTFGSGPPPMPGLAGEFQNSIQLVTGIALLLNRYVPLALVVSAAFLYNILAFHITMFPAGIVPGLILAACWVVLASSMRERLAPLFVS